MAIPLSYSYRNLATRRLTTFLTAGGMALVVFVFAATLMLVEGLRQTLVATGAPRNVLIIRKGSETEVQSGIERSQAAIMGSRKEIATGADGAPLAARELVVLIGLPKRGGDKIANVVIRGTDAASLPLRPQVRIIKGRAPRPGTSEIMAGTSVNKGFSGVDIGDRLRFGKRDWTVTGVFEAGNTAFASEIWGDGEQLMNAFGRNVFSVFVAELRNPALFSSFREAVEKDPRLTMEVWREMRFYEKQSEMMADFLRILGISLTLIFSMGAMIGAMITMYSAVAGRIGEIGTLRALGFTRLGILAAFLAEAAFLGALGGAMGLFGASFLQAYAFSTTNFQTFSELAFKFTLTGKIIAWSMFFALFMGIGGGLLPAIRAARMNIVEALRAA